MLDFIRDNYGKMSKAEIASHIGVSPGMVQYRAYSMGLTLGRGYWNKTATQERIQAAIDLYCTTDKSMKQCADEAGCGITTLHKYLKKMGLSRMDVKHQIGQIGEDLFEQYCESKGINYCPIENSNHQYDYFIDDIGINVKHGRTGMMISSTNISRMKENDEFWYFQNGILRILKLIEVTTYETTEEG